MLRSITLDGFKGRAATYQIDTPSLFVGPNGAGKTAVIDGIVYALTGKVAGGASAPDAVAMFFPRRGGTVTLTDDKGNWLRRGVTYDAKKKTVSEDHESSVTTADGKVDMGYWLASENVLRVSTLLGKSDKELTKEILALCGGGDGGQDVIAAIAARYAKMVGGKAATVAMLDDPSSLDDEGAEAQCREWTRPRGMRDVLVAALPREGSLSQKFLKLGERAKEERNAAVRSTRSTEEALKELEAEAQGAEAAAAELDQLTKEVEFQRDVVTEYREHRERMAEAAAAVEDAKKRDEDEAWTLAVALQALDATADPGPVVVSPPPAYDEGEYAACVAEYDAHRDTLMEMDARKTARVNAEREFERLVNQVRTIEGGVQHELRVRMDAVPDEAHQAVPALRYVVNAMLATWAKDHEEAIVARARAQEFFATLVARIAEDDAKRPGIRQAIAEVEDKLLSWRTAAKAQAATYATASKEWCSKAAAHDMAKRRVAAAESSLKTAEAALAYAEKRLGELSAMPQPENPEEKLIAIEAKRERAAEAAGTVKAYRDASERCKAAQLSVACWKLCEKAIEESREEVVVDATKPLLCAMDDVLAAVGRKEHAYVELENERGKSICQLGWAVNGTRTSVSALSAGELVLFTVALTVSVAMKSPGLKVLLVEADPLDDANLKSLLSGVLGLAPQLDALVVATASHVDVVPEGWAVSRLS